MRRVTIIHVVGVIIVSAVAVAQVQNGNDSAISVSLLRKLDELAPQQQISIQVFLRDRVDLVPFHALKKKDKGQMIRLLKSRMEKQQKPLRQWLKQYGVSDIRSLWINNSLIISVDPAVIRQLAQLPQVEIIEPDTVMHLGAMQSAGIGTPQWHLNVIEAPFLWSLGFDGTGVVVAGMDTGVDIHHPDLASRWRGGQNSWKDVFYQHSLPYDPYGHGTATMGVMVGGDAGGTSIGVAPGARWIAVKIFDDNGNTSYSKIHEGFQWLLDPDGNPGTPDAPDIVNNSWGLHAAVNQCIEEFQQDIDTLKAAGIAVVFAAGNAGPTAATSVSPANNIGNLSVGATDEAGTVASFSSRGPAPCDLDIFPSLSAPGTNLKTTDLTGDGTIPYSYAYVSGTSYASAVVSGSMALLLSAFPEMDVVQLEKTFFLSAVDSGETGPDDVYGNGIVNVAAAYELAASVCPADFLKDYEVGLTDMMILASEWLSQDCPTCQSDINHDGNVDYLDFVSFAQQFGKSQCP